MGPFVLKSKTGNKWDLVVLNSKTGNKWDLIVLKSKTGNKWDLVVLNSKTGNKWDLIVLKSKTGNKWDPIVVKSDWEVGAFCCEIRLGISGILLLWNQRLGICGVKKKKKIFSIQ